MAKKSTRSTKSSDEKRAVESEFDYIIVGSGAGGAPLAARLAEAGMQVLLIEAGSNHAARGSKDPGNEISRVPALHTKSSEHPDLAWRFFVEHYPRGANGKLRDNIAEDPKRHCPDQDDELKAQRDGIFYPRAAGIGGCTIHNAMITIAGPESDWDDLASFLGDPSWSGKRMRAYFRKLEHNDYLPIPDRKRARPLVTTWRYFRDAIQFLRGRRPDTSRGNHGFDGWLHTSFADFRIGLEDKQLVKMLGAALWQAKINGLDNAWTLTRKFFRGEFTQALDPNHSETQAKSPEGIVMVPLAVHGKRTTIHQNSATPYAMLGRRSSPRERLLETSAKSSNLTIWSECLVTKVILTGPKKQPIATGVELQRGQNLYRAHIRPAGHEEEIEKETVYVKKGGEVILCGGTFNTPQLLMLSGIGDPQELKKDCKVELPGVGKNLQDRYEVAVVSEMRKDFKLHQGATYDLPNDGGDPDQHLRQWREEGTGLYTTNGAVLGIFKRSNPQLEKPDLFIFGAPVDFRGYEVGYSHLKQHNLFSWIILKSHTHNRGGWVRLRSNDPRDTPQINFNYFGSADPNADTSSDTDLEALEHGVEFVRKIADSAKSVVQRELYPGRETDTNAWIRQNTWGHHACGTCRMGPDGDENAVLDSRFRVRGVENLRVVDASIFPKIPGYFIVSNIYMASEKAADVIIQDKQSHRTENPSYPSSLQKLEADAIKKRRTGKFFVSVPEVGTDVDTNPTTGQTARGTSATSFSSPVNAQHQWNEDVTGLALSGGGIRSATLGLGLLQSFARTKLLRRVDFLSTVSGGGYIGCFLGRFYDRLRSGLDQLSNEDAIADKVESELIKPNSPMIQWLRSHGNYIAPQGGGDGRLNFATFIRNFLSVHLVIGLAAFTVFGLANAIRFGVFDKILVGSGLLIPARQMPIGHLLHSLVGPWFSPWMIVAELLILFLVVPRIIGYWLVSPDKHESFKSLPLTLLFFVSALLLYLGVRNNIQYELVLIAFALLSSLLQVELAWRRGKQKERATGTGGERTRRARTLNFLTYDLGLAIALTGAAFLFTLIDSFGFALRELLVAGSVAYGTAFATLGGLVVGGAPFARWLANFFGDNQSGKTSLLAHFLKRGRIAGGIGVVFMLIPLIAYSFAAHVAYESGSSLWFGLSVTLLTALLTIVFAMPTAVGFVNRSSLSHTYAARLARAYLGASNPARQRPDGGNITEVIPGDDVATLRDYRPHEAKGPLHLINIIINQTVDTGSRLTKRDRNGLGLAVSPIGLSIGERWHGKWTSASSAGTRQSPAAVGVHPLGRPEGDDHPLVDQLNLSADRAEMLSLRRWMAISGAAVDPGQGRTTQTGIAFLMGLANLRTGYWWDSGIRESSRDGFPDVSFLRRVMYLIPRYFVTQSLLLFEWIARYPGPWQRFWHLSDGGFFENLGAYELIRRKVPRIIICDGGADPTYQFDCFAELTRKVRIDFAARIEPFSEEEISQLHPEVQKTVGTLDDLQVITDAAGNITEVSKKHAALFWVHYTDQPNEQCSVLMLLKASMTGDEPTDVQNYSAANPVFPHEPTADQSFDEVQWESYRKLGEHIGGGVFSGDWFWRIKLPPSSDGAA